MYYSKEGEIIINQIIDNAVKVELKKLSNEEKKYLLEHNDYVEHHFFYGLYLRNEYIHGNEELKGIVYDADELSEEIFNKIIFRLEENKKWKVHFFRWDNDHFRWSEDKSCTYDIFGIFSKENLNRLLEIFGDSATCSVTIKGKFLTDIEFEDAIFYFIDSKNKIITPMKNRIYAYSTQYYTSPIKEEILDFEFNASEYTMKPLYKEYYF